MLQLKNWVLSAPDRADRLLGYDGEHQAKGEPGDRGADGFSLTV